MQEFNDLNSSVLSPYTASAVQEFIQTGRKFSDSHKGNFSSLHKKKSLVYYVLEKIKIYFEGYGLTATWREICGRAPNGAIDVEDPKEFHRLWSAMNFAFCDTTDDSRGDGLTVSDPDEFGHGFAMAGCAFVHVLQQKNHFELLDFSYHVLNVKSHDNNVAEHSSQV